MVWLQSPLPIALHHPVSLISRTCLAPEAFEFVTPINAVSAAFYMKQLPEKQHCFLQRRHH